MSIKDKFIEGLYKLRIVPGAQETDKTSMTSEQQNLPNQIQEAIDTGKRIDLSQLLQVTTLTGDRNVKYSIFEEMVADGRIGAAVEMYANDTVQYGSDGRIMWVESDNSDVYKYVDKLLNDLNIESNLWSYAYCMYLYGDVYLETFRTASQKGNKPGLIYEPLYGARDVRVQKQQQGTKLERYIEKVPNAAEVYDLQIKGKTAGFVRNQIDNDNVRASQSSNTYTYQAATTDINVLNPTKFVHICLSPNINRFPEKFNLIPKSAQDEYTENGDIDGSRSEGTANTLSFTVKTGQSILENVYGPYQTLKLKEDSVLLERVTKSSITRVVQVELGDMPEAQKIKKLQEIKQQIEQQVILNKQAGTIQSRAGAQPTENIIYTTTKDGKGAISCTNIGGDADVGNTSDITDSENKLYGSLLIPKALLGADMEGSGLSNGGSLTEMNTTYARRIKRGQVALISGITDLVNIYALAEGVPNVIGNFKIKLTPIITVEDNRRDELLQNKVRNVSDMKGLLDDIETIDETTQLQILLNWFSKYLNQQEIVDIINEQIKKLEQEQQEKETEDNLDDIDAGEEHQEDDLDLDLDSNINMSNTFKNEPTEEPDLDREEPELAPQEDLNNIEGEDLL